MATTAEAVSERLNAVVSGLPSGCRPKILFVSDEEHQTLCQRFFEVAPIGRAWSRDPDGRPAMYLATHDQQMIPLRVKAN